MGMSYRLRIGTRGGKKLIIGCEDESNNALGRAACRIVPDSWWACTFRKKNPGRGMVIITVPFINHWGRAIFPLFG